MSTFGDGIFKQAIYEDIQYRMDDHGVFTVNAIQEVLEVCSYLLCGSGNDTAEIREQVKAELISELKGK